MDSNPPSSRPNSESPIMSHSQLGSSSIGGTNQTSNKSLKMALPHLDTTASKLQKGFSRVDYEAVYNGLSEGMDSSEWAQYKDTVGRFLTGKITRPELMSLITPLLTKNPAQSQTKIRLHNQFLLLLPLNSSRPDPPQTPAHFVSSSTLPTSHGYRSTPAQTELRLKTEVMALPYRDRKRIKQLPLSPPPSPPPERIQPLPNQTKPDFSIFSVQSQEFPDHEAMRMRMAPIMYEHGLKTQITPDLINFTTLASETFVKEILGSVLSRTSKHRRCRDEDPLRILPGQTAGKTPSRRPKRRYAETELGEEEKLITMDDIRLSCSLGENLIHLLPGALGRIMIGAGGRGEREFWGNTQDEIDTKRGERRFQPQEKQTSLFGSAIGEKDKEQEDEEDLGWEGSSKNDREELKGLLDGILTFP